ncbi:MAG: site-specific DNA-methyltransferase [Proteobacteria bacterium]|nr:site-specific DNA-methyltransferase [Pseudomonadota bacterium]
MIKTWPPDIGVKPYYADNQITIYHGDCRDILPKLPKVDLVLTDPPYGVGYRSNARLEKMDKIIGDDSVDIAVTGITMALAVLKNNRHIYVFGKIPLGGLPITEPVELIWDKTTPSKGNMSSTYGISHEYIQFSTYVPSQANRKRGDGRLATRLRRGSVLRYPRLNSRAVSNHPTEKPIPLLRELIESSSMLGETVLDPFVGAGSTLLAALLENRRCIGIEIEEKYCEIAANRCAAETVSRIRKGEY